MLSSIIKRMSNEVEPSMKKETSYQGARPVQGRTIRLHFRCHAEVPIGSYVRVTGSTLWAPATLISPTSDPQDAKDAQDSAHNNARASAGSRTIPTLHGTHEVDLYAGTEAGAHYASSVEMVTSPETYPIWETKRPVTIVLTNNTPYNEDDNATTISGASLSNKDVKYKKLHRYRYLIVTPGAVGVNAEDELEEGERSATSSNDEGSFQVMSWEDPFQEELDPTQKRTLSNVSLPSLKKGMTTRRLANLPFRTRTIHLSDKAEELDIKIPTDHWNERTDPTFDDYLTLIQEKNIDDDGIILNEFNAMEDDDENDVIMTDEHDQDVLMDESSDKEHKKERLFLVCYHLPVRLSRDPQTHKWSAAWSDSLISKTEGGEVVKSYDPYWLGTVSSSESSFSTEAEQQEIRQLLLPMKCTPLFLDDAIKKAHYYGMCKQVLWPAFHNIDLMELSNSGWGQRDLTFTKSDSARKLIEKEKEQQKLVSYWDQSRLDKWWDAYSAVNLAFASTLTSVLQPDDIVWIHDYHLSLLPQMLSEATINKFNTSMKSSISSNSISSQNSSSSSPTPKMVFFLHIPFPTSQIFRELEFGEAILEGILHSDVVGFHAFDHARHFLNASKRILGLTYESLTGGLIGVQFRTRTVLVTMSNVSIEPDLVDKALQASQVHALTQEIITKYPQRTIISGIDIAQRLSGISLKLLAYERLLTDYPIWQNKVVLIQKCLLPQSRRADEVKTIKEIRFLVRRLRERFGNDVIDFEEIKGSNYPTEKRLALWSATNVTFFTVVREGLNLYPLEYVYVRAALEKPGVTIASEFSAVSSILNGALRVNPFDIQMVATNLDKAIGMDDIEKEGRLSRDIDFVSSCPSDQWTNNVLRDLRDVTKQKEEEKKLMNENNLSGGPGTIASFLKREGEIAFNHVDIDALVAAYKASKRRVIISDFNGTIVIKEAPGKYLKREVLGSSGLRPPRAVIKALADMCIDPCNTVYVVSGDSQENVENAIGHVDTLGLAASNGACYSLPNGNRSIDGKREWEYFDLGVDWNAVKKVALPIMAKYTARTNGSWVKLTHSSIGWSYYSCDPEWGSLQATHLVMELENELAPFEVRFVSIKGIIEVVPKRLNKGLICKKILQEVSVEEDVDFILCVGDDVQDEKMFSAVFSFVSGLQNTPPTNKPSADVTKKEKESKSAYCFTFTVGKKPSHASQYLDDAPEVANMLIRLVDGDTSERSMSWGNMNEMKTADFFA